MAKQTKEQKEAAAKRQREAQAAKAAEAAAQYGDINVSTGQRNQALATRPTTMLAVRDLIVAKRDQIAGLLPGHLDAGRLARLALISIRQTPKLQDCTPESLLGAILQAAQLGLEPDGTLGQAYLVPYKTNATLQIGYRGMIELARRSGKVRRIAARVVYDGDHLEYETGLEDRLVHRPNLKRKADAEVIAVYAVAELEDGAKVFDVLTKDEIERARSASRNRSGEIWSKYYDEMARKTAVRRLFKYLPVSVELSRALALDEVGEAGAPQNLDLTLTTEAELVDQPLPELPAQPEPKQDRQQAPQGAAQQPQEAKGGPEPQDSKNAQQGAAQAAQQLATCEGCGEEAELLDGQYCAECLGEPPEEAGSEPAEQPAEQASEMSDEDRATLEAARAAAIAAAGDQDNGEPLAKHPAVAEAEDERRGSRGRPVDPGQGDLEF